MAGVVLDVVVGGGGFWDWEVGFGGLVVRVVMVVRGRGCEDLFLGSG